MPRNPLNARNRPLKQPGQSRNRRARFRKGRRPEKVVDQRDHRGGVPARCKERDLVQILDNYVEIPGTEFAIEIPSGMKRKGVASPCAMDFDAVQLDPVRRAFKSRDQGDNFVPGPGDPSEGLVQMRLGAPSQGFSRSCQLTTRMRTRSVSQARETLVKGVQHPIHEPGRLVAAILLGQKNGLLYGDFGRDIFHEEHLCRSQAKKRPIDGGQPLQAPVVQ